MTIEVSTGRAFAKLIVRLVPVATYGTVIRGGCQVVPPSCAVPSKPVHVAPVAVPHTQPHMGTALPSGTVAVWRVAVRVTWANDRSEEHTSELQSRGHLVCRLLLEKKNQT